MRFFDSYFSPGDERRMKRGAVEEGGKGKIGRIYLFDFFLLSKEFYEMQHNTSLV